MQRARTMISAERASAARSIRTRVVAWAWMMAPDPSSREAMNIKYFRWRRIIERNIGLIIEMVIEPPRRRWRRLYLDLDFGQIENVGRRAHWTEPRELNPQCRDRAAAFR